MCNNDERDVSELFWLWLSHSTAPHESFVEAKQVLIQRCVPNTGTDLTFCNSSLSLMVQNRWVLEHVILLLKSIKAGLKPGLRIAVATVWQMERLLPQDSRACPSVGPDSNPVPNPLSSTPAHGCQIPSPQHWGSQLRLSVTTPWCDVAWPLSESKPNQTNHYFSMVHSTVWVIKATSLFENFLPLLGKDFRLGYVLTSVTALIVGH